MMHTVLQSVIFVPPCPNVPSLAEILGTSLYASFFIATVSFDTCCNTDCPNVLICFTHT